MNHFDTFLKCAQGSIPAESINDFANYTILLDREAQEIYDYINMLLQRAGTKPLSIGTSALTRTQLNLADQLRQNTSKFNKAIQTPTPTEPLEIATLDDAEQVETGGLPISQETQQLFRSIVEQWRQLKQIFSDDWINKMLSRSSTSETQDAAESMRSLNEALVYLGQRFAEPQVVQV